MPSSPGDPDRLDPARKLAELAETYDLVFEAVARDDLDRASALLERAGAMLDSLAGTATGSAVDGEACQALGAAARASHGRALAGMQEALDRAGAELRKAREGRRVLRGYGRRGETLGRRVSAYGG